MTRPPPRGSFVDFRDVSLAYDGQAAFAVEDITLSIAPGEFVAIVGPSGCGKSTFMKLATGLKPPTRGEVDVDGARVTGPLKIVGMAFQAPTLLPWRTTLDNVLLPLEIVEPYRATFKRDRAQVRRARAGAARRPSASTATRTSFPGSSPAACSSVRRSAARSSTSREMLLLDEPFGALDAFTREELWCVLRDLWAAQRFTVILVTHDLREAVFLADTVYVMSKRPGRILARREIDLPRPRDLEVTYTDAFTDIVHELRERIGWCGRAAMSTGDR